MKSFFVHNGSAALHVLENGFSSPETPSLLVIGGLWEPAERAIPILSGLGSHTVALESARPRPQLDPCKGLRPGQA